METWAWVRGWLNPITISGASFWALGMYWGWSKWADRAIAVLEEKVHPAAASLLAIVPFCLLALALELFWESYLGRSWAVSCGILVCAGSGVLKLGELDRQMQAEKEAERREKGDRRRPR
ncbi:MAG: hypothetical protein AAFY15_07085 [Cyanobacteria bacterium J06648_11]